MIMKKSKILYFIFILPLFVLAQSKQISGVVLDEDKSPLPGVNVLVKGFTAGTSTDFDGNFLLKIPEGASELEISYTGYSTQVIAITDQNNYNVQLVVDNNLLEEVVVIGYGTVRKSDLTGAVSSVKVDETVARQSTTVDQLLSGRAAGVQVIQNGTPGAGVSVRIRGGSSLRGNNEPLYVVDGVIISSAGEDAASADKGGNSAQESQNGLNGINPRDIESMEILKDASATAIYGSRGANGVVLITTKKGKKGKARINAYTTSSVSVVDKKFDMLNAVDFARYRNEAQIIGGNTPAYHIEDGEVYPVSSGNISETPARQVNWQDEIYKPGYSTQAGVSISGGSDTGNYYVSFGFNDQGGVVDNSRFQSGDIRLNMSQNLNKNLKMDVRLSGFQGNGEFAQDGDRTSGQRSFISNVLTYRPLIVTDEEDLEDLELSNPYSWITDYEDITEESRFFGNIAFTYTLPVKGLKYKIQMGGNKRYKERRRFYGLTTFLGQSLNGSLGVSDLKSTSYQINNLLQYNRTFNKIHRFNAVLGITYDVRKNNNEIYQLADFSTVEFRNEQPKYAQLVTTPLEAIISETQLMSYLGRVNYTLMNKYIFTGSFRVDGSSKFTEGNKHGFFPSASFAWKMHQENFMQSQGTINELKLRVGWGQIGNQAISPYQTASNYGSELYGTPSDGTGVSFVPVNIANDELTWETTEQLNAGVDIALWNNRVTATIDAYMKETDDLLQQVNLPRSTGFGSMLINRGSLSNKGLEFALSGTAVNTEDFRLDVSGNIAFNKSEITKLGIPLDNVIIDGETQQRSFYLGQNVSSGSYFKSPANIFIEGEEVGLFYGFETDGIYQEGDDIPVSNTQVGDIRIIDQLTVDTDNDGVPDAGDGVINGADRTIIGNPNPDFIFGLNINMEYKRFNLSMLFNGTSGNEIANGNLVRTTSLPGNGTNILATAYHNAWRPERPSNLFPRVGYDKENGATAITDRIIEDGSYFRLSNVTLGYDVPVSDGIIESMDLYLSGINLFTITGYSGYNPEITSFLNNANIVGVDWNGLPNVSTVTLGVNVNF